jgi:hypothetical protein
MPVPVPTLAVRAPSPNVALDGRAGGNAAPQTGAGLAYGTLCQAHPSYSERLFKEIDDLYTGGYQIMRNARDYLYPMVQEESRRYEERCSCASYAPYFGTIVDQFASDLFGQQLSVKAAADAENPQTPGDPPDKKYYPAFEKNCDGRGTVFVDMMRAVLITSLKHRTSIVCVDAPNTGLVDAVSLADEDKAGARNFYCYEVPPAQLIDWEEDDLGEFQWAILRTKDRPRDDPTDSRSRIVETFTLWTLPPNGGKAAWARYQITYTDQKPPKDTDLVSQVDAGTSSFARIPLLRMRLPDGLWVGNKIGPMAREHFQRRSALISAENRSLVVVPLVTLGSEISAPGNDMPSEVQQDSGRARSPAAALGGKGYMVLGKDDNVTFPEPNGHAYEIVDKQLEALREAMYQVNHQMAASVKPTGGALGRSVLSKQKDQDSTDKVLRALGQIVRQFALKIYDTIAKARGEDVIWTAHGLDSYENEDRAVLVQEANAVSAIAASIQSETFHVEYESDMARKLKPGLSPETQVQIRTEIQESVKAKLDLAKTQMKVQKDQLLNPPAPAAPAGFPPKPGGPAPNGKPQAPPPRA